jgi:type IV secretory pathway VirB4 component
LFAQKHLFFIGGLSGTGKTYLYNLLLANVRREGDIALAVASSGIAALLLEGGRTAHSRLKIPIANLNETSTSQ